MAKFWPRNGGLFGGKLCLKRLRTLVEDMARSTTRLLPHRWRNFGLEMAAFLGKIVSQTAPNIGGGYGQIDDEVTSLRWRTFSLEMAEVLAAQMAI